jgi:hypothetical protein
MPQIIWQKWIFRSDLKDNPEILYLFGDNHQRQGYGGQAKEMRDEPNAVGIRTKWMPSMDPAAFFSDNELDVCMEMINKDFAPVFERVQKGGLVVIPSDGLGTGLSELPKRAPTLNRWLNLQLAKLQVVGERNVQAT